MFFLNTGKYRNFAPLYGIVPLYRGELLAVLKRIRNPRLFTQQPYYYADESEFSVKDHTGIPDIRVAMDIT